MPKSRDWSSFLNEGDKKTELIRFIAEIVKTKEFLITLKINDNIWLLEAVKIQYLDSCNHHDADTGIVLHAMRAVDSCPIIVVASDADILVLLIYAVEKYNANDPAHMIQMKIDAESLSPIFF